MADEKKIPKMPPLPPGMLKPGLPPTPPGGKPSLPGMPAMPSLPPMQQAGFPALPQGGFQPQYQQSAAPQPPAKDDAGERRLQEERDRLEKKIGDMEKLLSQEKEKALLATLKNQQDEALSSRVESSLKDIQDKMRRDRRDHEVEEERLTLKSKIKELETRLSQERETWMTTLKNQMSEREVQGRDVEGHFVYRLQEMERRWLDEKAQWQKEISAREELIRSLKSSSEKLRDVEDEYRKVSLEKSMAEREISKLRDDLARSDREKASVETYLKMMPEKEREISDVRSENALLRSREETSRMEAKHRDEKNVAEIGRLQAEIGALSDRKNAELNEALRKAAEPYEAQLQEKDKTIADVSGEKVRAISELMKIKGFVSRVQAINAVLEKERGQLKLEKMQLAQNMASQMEELRRLKSENEGMKAAHHAELESQAARFTMELENTKSAFRTELSGKFTEKTAEMTRAHQEEVSRLRSESQAELSRTAASHRIELSRAAEEHQAEMDSKLGELRARIERSSAENAQRLRTQLEDEYKGQYRSLKELSDASETAKARLEQENRRLYESAKDLEKVSAAKQEELAARAIRAETQSAALASQKAEFEKYISALEAERARLAADISLSKTELARLSNELKTESASRAGFEAELAKLLELLASSESRLKATEEELVSAAEKFRLESENRACFETEVLNLKQKIRQAEYQLKDFPERLQAEREQHNESDIAWRAELSRMKQELTGLRAELAKYKTVEGSLVSRLKWAVKAPGGVEQGPK